MIPVLGMPVLERYDLLAHTEKSVDVDVHRYYVVDNGGRYEGVQVDLATRAQSTHVCQPGANIGWGASLNLVIKANVEEPWWCFSNDDILFEAGQLARVAEFMWAATSRPVFAQFGGCGFAAFAVNDLAVERVGFFDESYHPAYCEDCDWDWRRQLLGDVEWHSIPGETIHYGSQTIAMPHRKRQNDRTYPKNKEYHWAKWGGEPREEVFRSPFNAGGHPSITTAPKLIRLREMAWWSGPWN